MGKAYIIDTMHIGVMDMLERGEVLLLDTPDIVVRFFKYFYSIKCQEAVPMRHGSFACGTSMRAWICNKRDEKDSG
jgi:hypothetical protein